MCTAWLRLITGTINTVCENRACAESDACGLWNNGDSIVRVYVYNIIGNNTKVTASMVVSHIIAVIHVTGRCGKKTSLDCDDVRYSDKAASRWGRPRVRVGCLDCAGEGNPPDGVGEGNPRDSVGEGGGALTEWVKVSLFDQVGEGVPTP